MENVEVKELEVTGNLYINGRKVEGVEKTTWGNSCLIDRAVLDELLRTKENYLGLQASFTHLQKIITEKKAAESYSVDKEELDQVKAHVRGLEDALANAEAVITSLRAELETATKPDMSEIRALSADARARKRDRGFALAISSSIRGYSNYRITQELRDEGYGASKAHIARALSVTKEGDKERIRSIMALYPECFEDVAGQDFEKWFSDRYERLTKSARIREENRKKNRSQGDSGEWGETEDGNGMRAVKEGNFAGVLVKTVSTGRKIPQPKSGIKVEKPEATIGVLPAPSSADIGLGEMPKYLIQ